MLLTLGLNPIKIWRNTLAVEQFTLTVAGWSMKRISQVIKKFVLVDVLNSGYETFWAYTASAEIQR